MIKSNKRLIIILISFLLPLFIPLIAMQYTNEVDWNMADFIIAGILLFITGFGLEIILSRIKQTKYRIVFIFILFILFLVIWAEIAVGVFGSPIAGS